MNKTLAGRYEEFKELDAKRTQGDWEYLIDEEKIATANGIVVWETNTNSADIDLIKNIPLLLRFLTIVIEDNERMHCTINNLLGEKNISEIMREIAEEVYAETSAEREIEL